MSLKNYVAYFPLSLACLSLATRFSYCLLSVWKEPTWKKEDRFFFLQMVKNGFCNFVENDLFELLLLSRAPGRKLLHDFDSGINACVYFIVFLCEN